MRHAEGGAFGAGKKAADFLKNCVKNGFRTDFSQNCDKKLDRKAQLLYLAPPFPDNISTTKEKSCVLYLYVKENRSTAL